jgi:hypothetical protein
MKFGAGGEFSLVRRFDTLPAIPPGAATIEIGSNIRRTDDRHGTSIAQIF